MSDEVREPAHDLSHYRDLVHEGLLATDAAPSVADRADLVFNLMKLTNRMSRDFESVHRSHGVTWAGFRVMNMLRFAGPMEVREVARVSGSSRASISAVLNTLERDGFVVRERDVRDRRQVRVVLTDEGQVNLRVGIQDQADRDRAWFDALSPEQEHELGLLLELLADQPTPP